MSLLLPPLALLLLLAALVAPATAATAYRPDWNRLSGLTRARVEVSATPDLSHFIPLQTLSRLYLEETGVIVSDALVPPQVKAFVTQDIPFYHNLVMKHLPGADPELVLLGRRYEELERIPLSEMTREEITRWCRSLGFYRKAAPDAHVPPEYV
uniref:Selenoprotein M n=1 Tax=Nomascus leucogenys TaxID=61853 RepID=M3ZA63_NOMLE